MTNLHVHSNSSDQTPVADVKERLAQILETVLQLYRVPLIRTGAPIGAIRWT